MDEVAIAWSGGKDSTLALRAVAGDPAFEVRELVTTVSAESGRIRSHEVDGDLLERQAEALGYPLRTVEIPADGPNDVYERRMADVAADYDRRGIDRLVFADLFLEDVRAYRESLLEGHDVEGYWPLWGRDSRDVVEEFLDAGYRGTVVRVDGSRLDRAFACRTLDEAFLADLPADVDPCGERGEFHTFVSDGPLFDRPVAIEREGCDTRTVDRGAHGGTYHYCRLRPTDER